MSCSLCRSLLGKNKKAIRENKCDKCYFCSCDSCNKRAILNGFCKIHVSSNSIKKESPIRREVNESDIVRRECHRIDIEIRKRSINMLKEKVIDVKTNLPYVAIDSSNSDLEYELILNRYTSLIDDENERIEREINEFKARVKYINDQYENLRRGKIGNFDFKKEEEEEENIPHQYCNIDNLYYQLLGIPMNERNPGVIKKAYWVRAKEVHPDKHPGEEDKYTKIFQNLYNAYEFIMSSI